MTSREKFEAWISDNGKFQRALERKGDVYLLATINTQWEAWQAAESALEQKLTDLAVQLANAESKCRELAAENAGLKNPDNWLSQSDYGYEASEVATQDGATEDESLRAGMVAIINRIETPATDAFLAEVRAQGVEMYADTLDRGADDAECGGFDDGVKFLRAEAAGVREFAAQLRMERG
ncbi:hypothetical protein [Citrobacter freundii]|uniref:hypothetical protein n=1 Tax=Citrobacter freundii TaxID=546 RepID=UPI001917A3C4|nr:hypothetical protein [Citrobacter freundii]